ncbi:hypothetical protein K2173_020252 [Erythroxylum novogranatense]|uniref:Leucine-rich repeat-containing N-terminal plant-type domain-containing protein n=1 Tax=Erythroxylum novogranatense TaxID=1862640 RepID=A0AAV8UBV7_9ROSI|nr:hypothetical protein K2173_020252 [Erythroxylum novogranatense]
MAISHIYLSVIVVALRLHTRIAMACNYNDLTALNGFSKCLTSKIDGWESTEDCCTWNGVACDNSSTASSKRVVSVDLGNKKIAGRICESIGGLDRLRTLNLSHNSLHGNPPPNLFRLQNLEVLDLSSNNLVGPVLEEGIDLPSIRYFDISTNYFNGSADAALCENSPNVQVLNLGNNRFSGGVSTNFGSCTSLLQLFLNGNNLSGSFPEILLQLKLLNQLHLQENWFSGPVSVGIKDLSNLVDLDLSDNLFSGGLPDAFENLGKLELFSASSNNLSGNMPKSLVNSPSLVALDLRNNSLSGPLNLNCSAMIHLNSLNLGRNYFDGLIPESMSSCKSLGTLNLARNKLEGEIPNSFRNLQALRFVSLSNNSLVNLTRALDVLGNCKNLSIVVLTLNFKEEQIPSDMNLQFANLRALVIANCRLRGSLPLWLNDCKKLQVLDLSWNLLGGALPIWLGNFRHLFYLDLSNNSFTGNMPKSLTELKALTNRNITLEGMLAEVPFYRRRQQNSTGLAYNSLGSLPPTLDLSRNNLSGPIWPAFGKLIGLHVLNLKNNYLSGSIPDGLSGMVSMETLDLSHNFLSGQIPNSLIKLSFLSKFSVAYNQLQGEIPTGGQFMTFPYASFEGNNGLCGEFFISCRPTQNPPVSSDEHMDILGWPFGIGVATGFLLSTIICFTFGLADRIVKRIRSILNVGNARGKKHFTSRK